MTYKLGSLFDGSGGFPLAGGLCGIEPVWASEVEPYPIAVTKTRIPNMKHLGDISKINGADIEPVDVITFGSPCQDLSVAGKRAGLKHEDNGDEETTRSGLFMEAVRIIREMREATNGQYPTFALWENVPGAFNSNKGEDFRTVLEELIKIVEPQAVMPAVPKNGWPYADCYLGDGWSLAYRTFDAQYWGVPQRRRRIHLVADFRDERAGEVLFERQGLRGYFAQIGETREAAATNAQGGTGAANREGKIKAEGFDSYNLAVTGSIARTLAGSRADNEHIPCAVISSVGFDAYQHHGWRQSEKLGTLTAKSSSMVRGDTPLVVEQEAIGFDGYNQQATGNVAKTLVRGRVDASNIPIVFTQSREAREGLATSEVKTEPIAVETQQGGAEISENGICPTITAAAGMSGNNQPWICKPEPVPYTLKIRSGCEGGGKGALIQENKSATLATNNDQYLFQPVPYRQGGFAEYIEGEYGTLRASGGDFGGGSENLVIEKKPQYIVRRLTPTECARLQGFGIILDRWGDIEQKDDFTDDEYNFWLEVRNTHAIINGREEKEYTKAQMLTWYNKLHTDGAEYKMWGNGIALPPALYCMQGIVDALDRRMAETNEAEATDLSDAPQEIKEEIMENAEKLEKKTAEEIPAAVTPEEKPTENKETEPERPVEEKTTAAVPEKTEEPVNSFNAVEQLRQLAKERKVLSELKPGNDRFLKDVNAIEYAVSVLEAVGL